jgi:hypothetical protein
MLSYPWIQHKQYATNKYVNIDKCSSGVDQGEFQICEIIVIIKTIISYLINCK